MKRTRLAAVTGAAAFAAAGLAGGGVIAACSSPGPGSSAVSTPSTADG